MIDNRVEVGAENVRVDLFPERGSRPPVRDHSPGEGQAQVTENVSMVSESEGDRFQYRAIHGSARGAEMESDESPAEVGVVEGALLAEEIGEAEERASWLHISFII